MACREGRKLHQYLEGELSPQARAALQEHLRGCTACRCELASLRRLERALEGVRPAEPPSDLTSEALQRAQVRLARPRPAAGHLFAAWASGAAAVAAIALIVVCLYSRPHTNISPVRPELSHAVPSAPVLATRPVKPMMVAEAPSTSSAKVSPPVTRSPEHRASRLTARPRRRPRIAESRRPHPIPAPRATTASTENEAALAAYNEATNYASDGDPVLSVAALENVATAYPHSPQAAKALLAAAQLEQSQGNTSEADREYRRVLALSVKQPLTQALAHKALADMRRTTVGVDEVALYHYTEAVKELRGEAKNGSKAVRSQALMALGQIEATLGDGNNAVAAYTRAEANTGSSHASENNLDQLADVL